MRAYDPDITRFYNLLDHKDLLGKIGDQHISNCFQFYDRANHKINYIDSSINNEFNIEDPLCINKGDSEIAQRIKKHLIKLINPFNK